MGTRVVVIGGGVIGCFIAYELAGRGVQVTVVERDTVGAHASRVAAGMLPPLSESKQSGPFLNIALKSLHRFIEVAPILYRESGIDIELRDSGTMRVALEEDDKAKLLAAYEWQKDQGLDLDWLEPKAARLLEPLLVNSIAGALYCPDEKQVRSRRLVAALVEAAAGKGVEFQQGTMVIDLLEQDGRINGVKTSNGNIESDYVVLAAGPWSTRFNQWIGFDLPITPKRGQIIRLEAKPQPLKHILHAHGRYLVPRADGTIVLGATSEDAGFDTRPTAKGVSHLLKILPNLAPQIAYATIKSIDVGFRPWSADTYPILGFVPERDGLVVATGHGRNGILLSAITGQLIAKLIAEQKDEIPMDLKPNRFIHEPVSVK